MIKVNRSVEQAVFVMMVMAVQQGHAPMPSSTLSTILEVSDSYLKKTLRKLVRAGLVTSATGHEGGFALARPADKITFGDVWRAIETDEWVPCCTGLSERTFGSCPDAARKTLAVQDAFREASNAYGKSLDAHRLSDYLNDTAWREGVVDWNKR